MTIPKLISQLSMPIITNNFTPVQSAQLVVSNSGASGSQSIVFTTVPGTGRVTFKFTNSGTKGCYIATGPGSATAVASTATPTPAFSSSVSAVATCDYVAAGAIITQDYAPGTTTIAAICGGADTTTLEISIGMGQ